MILLHEALKCPSLLPIPKLIRLTARGKHYHYLERTPIQRMISVICDSWFSKYYSGGFEQKMTRSEAALILGVPYNARIEGIKKAHKRLMIINHPDKGGSPYLAMKINEAKDLLNR